MRNLLLAIVFLFIISSQSFSQWFPQNSGTTNRFMTCFFLDDNLGWAAGNLGTIVKTTNGGQNWSTQSISTTDHVHSIFFNDPLNGWLVLYEFVPDRHGSILSTTNGGDSWYTQLTVWGYSLHRIFFTDSNNGYALGSNGILYKTTNGGQSWNDISPFNSYWLYSTFFFDPLKGWIGGGLEGYFLRTINGGQSWSSISLPVIDRMMCLYFINESNGWACGANGKILRTTNSGLDWLLGNSGVNVELRDIQFIDQNEGWSVGLNGRIIHTTNGGINWSQQNSGINSSLFGVHFANELTGWVVGENGIIMKTNNGGVPVELITFSGVNIDGKVQLNWSTASELNNLGFEIERASEIKDWRNIGFVDGRGTTTEIQNYSFTDDLFGVQANKIFYRLKQIDFNGTYSYSKELELHMFGLPNSYLLAQNYPNPFNPLTTIRYSLKDDCNVNLQIFDVLGTEVASLVDSYEEAGTYEVIFDGSRLSSGIYYYVLKAGEFNAVKKLILLK